MIFSLAAAALVGYLPGAVFFRLPIGRRDDRADLTADERVFWHVILSLTWSLAVVLALGAVRAYTFDRLLVANGLLTLGLIAISRSGLRYRGTARRWSIAALAPVLLVALGYWQFLPASEYVIGGKDPGTYMNEGIQIAQRGSLVTVDPVVSGIPGETRDLFFPSHQRDDYYGLRFMGFWIQDPNAGTVVGQFPHLFPASIAIGYGLDGLSGARDAVAFWATLGLVALYLAAAPLIGRPAALAAAVLLGLNVVTVWFARYPNAEVLMQVMLLAAALAVARAREGAYRFFGSVAGILVAGLIFLRFDAVLAVAAFLAAWTALSAVRERLGAGFLLAQIAIGVVALEYLLGPMRAYAAYPLGFAGNVGGWLPVAAAAAAMLAFRAAMRHDATAAVVRGWLPATVAVSLVALAVYAWFVREAGGRLAAHDADAFRHMAWYVTPWGLAAGVIGLAGLVRTSFWRSPALFTTIAVFAVFFFYKTRIVPEHFWTMRRFLAVVLPALMLGIAGLAAFAARAVVRTREPASDSAEAGRRFVPIARGIICTALLVPIAIVFWRQAEPVRHHVEYAGLIPQLEAVAAEIGPGDFVIVESRNASDTHVLAVPLAYIYAKPLLVLNNPAPDKRLVEDFLRWAEGRYERVLFMGGGGTDLLSRRMTATPVSSWQFQVPEYDAPTNAYPDGVRMKEFDFGFYALGIDRGTGDGPVAIDVDVGELDELEVIRFHAKEQHASGDRFRWSRDVSYVLLGNAGATAREVAVWMSDGGRPAAAPAPIVEVAVGEFVLGQVTVTDELQPYRFAIPPDVADWMGRQDAPVRLRLRVPTWSPQEYLGVNDPRELGVIVSRVEVR